MTSQRLSHDVLTRPTAGHNIAPGATFATVVDTPEQTALLVFLRHFG